MDQKKYKRLQDLARAHSIVFDTGPDSATNWPTSHKRLFGNIKQLGRQIFENYCQNEEDRLLDEPWRDQTVRRAERLSHLAYRCHREGRNEAGWRLLLEPEIFARFSVEVAWYLLYQGGHDDADEE